MQKQIISKKSWVSKLIDESTIQLSENSVIMLDAAIEDIAKIEVIGNQLKVTLKNGEVIIVDNFNPELNDLVLRTSDSELLMYDFLTAEYNPIDKVEVLLNGVSTSSFVSIWPMVGTGIGAILAGAAAAGGGGGSSESNGPNPVDVASTAVSEAEKKTAEAEKQWINSISNDGSLSKEELDHLKDAVQSAQNDKDKAQKLVDELKDQSSKDALQERLDDIQERLNGLNDIVLSVEDTLQFATAAVALAESKVAAAETVLADAKADGNVSDAELKQLEAAVEDAQSAKDAAQNLVGALDPKDDALQNRLDAVQDRIDALNNVIDNDTNRDGVVDAAEAAVAAAEQARDEAKEIGSQEPVDVADLTAAIKDAQALKDAAQVLVNEVADAEDKADLQERLDSIQKDLDALNQLAEADANEDGVVDAAEAAVAAAEQKVQVAEDVLKAAKADGRITDDELQSLADAIEIAKQAKISADEIVSKVTNFEDKSALELRLSKVQDRIDALNSLLENDEFISLANNAVQLVPEISIESKKPDEKLEKVTTFSVANVGLGPVLQADVLSKILSQSLSVNVDEGTQRLLSLKSESGGVQLVSFMSLYIYRKDESSGNFVQHKVEKNWLKAYLLGGVSKDLGISLDSGEYIMFLAPEIGVTALTGYTLKVLSDEILDYNDAVTISGEHTGNVLTDIDPVHGVDILPADVNISTVNGTVITSENTVINGLYGKLTISPNGEYSYTLNAGITQPFAADKIEKFIYTVQNGDKTISAELNIQLVNEISPVNMEIDQYVQINVQPTLSTIKVSELSKDEQKAYKKTDFAVLELGLLNPLIKAEAVDVNKLLNFEVNENTIRELTFKGDAGGITVGGVYDLYIYRLDENTNQYVLFHSEQNWFNSVLLGGVSKELELGFTEGKYIAALQSSGGLNLLTGSTLYITQDKTQDFNVPLVDTFNGEVKGNVTTEDQVKLLNVNGKTFVDNTSVVIKGIYGDLTISIDGSYTYQLNSLTAESNVPYGQVESFTYQYLASNGEVILDVLNLKLDVAQPKDDQNTIVSEITNKVMIETQDLNVKSKSINGEFVVSEGTMTNIALDIRSTVQLNKGQIEFILKDAQGSIVSQQILTNTKEFWQKIQVDHLQSGQYTYEISYLNSTWGYFDTAAGNKIAFENIDLTDFVLGDESKIIEGKLLNNDVGGYAITSITIGGKTVNKMAGNTSIEVEGKYGILTLKSDGSYTYKPNSAESGVEEFEYIIGTAMGSSNSAFLTIQVNTHTGTLANEYVVSTAEDDVYELGLGSDTLIFDVLDASDNTAGNGFDTWSDFHIATSQADANADVIDLRDVLSDTTTSQNISEYISIAKNTDGQTIISIDRDGKGEQFKSAELLNIGVQSTDLTLQNLLDNNQILF